MTTTKKAPAEADKTRGMAPLGYRIVQYGVYTMPFFINPTAPTRTECTKGDIDLVLKLIPYAYAHTASYVRPFVGVRHAWYMEHKSELGSCSDFALIAAMTPKKKSDPDKPSASWDDYDVLTKLPDDLRSRFVPFRDLMEVVDGTPRAQCTKKRKIRQQLYVEHVRQVVERMWQCRSRALLCLAGQTDACRRG